MKKLAIMLFTGCSCAHVTFVDDSEKTAKAWVCFRDPDAKQNMLCGDLETVLEAVQKKSAADM